MSELPRVDSRNNWRLLDEMLASEKDAWRRTMLLALKEHMQAECGGNLEALLATMVDEPIFHNWTAIEDSGPKGYAAVKEFYTGLIGSGSNRFEYHIQRIIIGDDTLVTEGTIRTPFSGAMLKTMGMDDVKEEAFYATQGRAVTFWPFDSSGKIIGEDIHLISTDFTDIEEVELVPYSYGE
ncbi:MAG: nuclear transport factor 2 family protein [Pseudomonadota bacterium]